MKLTIVDIVTIVSVVAAAAVVAGTMLSEISSLTDRVEKLETNDPSPELNKLRWEVNALKCQANNIKHILKGQPETDCS